MNKCACCGKDTANPVKVGEIGLCCEYCATMMLEALQERKEEALPFYGMIKNPENYVDSENYKTNEDSIVFFAYDADKRKHFFCIREMVHQNEMVTYIAEEIYEKGQQKDSFYTFTIFGHIRKENRLISDLINKTAQGISNSFIEYDSFQPHVRSTGEMEVVYLGDAEDSYGWKIDGQIYTPDEVMRLFSCYEGRRIVFQTTDAADDILKKDTLLMPVVMNEKTFADELSELISVFSDNNERFIRSENVASFDVFFFKLMDKLEFYVLQSPGGVGKIVGMKMIRLLEEIETDDDMFPEHEISVIRDVISINEEFNHPEITNKKNEP